MPQWNSAPVVIHRSAVAEKDDWSLIISGRLVVEDDWLLTGFVAEDELANIEIERFVAEDEFPNIEIELHRKAAELQRKAEELQRKAEEIQQRRLGALKQELIKEGLKRRIKERGGQGGVQEAKRERARHGDDGESRLVAQHNHGATAIQHGHGQVKIPVESLYLIRRELGNHTMQYVFNFTPEPIVDILFDNFAEYAKHLRECKKNPRMQKAIRECEENPPPFLQRIGCCAWRSMYGLWWMPIGKDAKLIKYSIMMKCLAREGSEA